MGLRFRKSIKIAPDVKLNLNKKSASVTLGGKGVHYTVNSKGKRTASVGIPGTGLSYSESSGATKKKKASRSISMQPKQATSQNTSKTGGGKKNKWCIWIIIAVLAIAIIGSPTEDTSDSVPETITAIETVTEATTNSAAVINTETETTTETETSTETIAETEPETETSTETITETEPETETASEIEVYSKLSISTETSASAESVSVASSDLNTTPATKPISPASEQPVPITDSSAASTSLPAAPEAADTIVYITDTGKKYHRQGCRHLKKSCIEINLDQAVLQYEPCGVCNPPTK